MSGPNLAATKQSQTIRTGLLILKPRHPLPRIRYLREAGVGGLPEGKEFLEMVAGFA